MMYVRDVSGPYQGFLGFSANIAESLYSQISILAFYI